jgi:hypothetical protein
MSPSRYVINFFDWDLEKKGTQPAATDFPEALRIVREKVKPEREVNLGKNPMSTRRGALWWRYGSDAKTLYQSIKGLTRIIVLSRISNHLAFGIVPSNWVYSDRVTVFATDNFAKWSVLQSSFHYVWAWNYGTTNLSLLSYSPSECFCTFPFPNKSLESDHPNNLLWTIGENLNYFRGSVCVKREEGLTDIYNHYHDFEDSSTDIQQLRNLHIEMDNEVASAYCWTDLKLDHDFHETKQGIRFTISEDARREVLQRLLKLNHERYAEEVKQGLHDKKKGKAVKAKIQKDEDTPEEGEEDQDQITKTKNKRGRPPKTGPKTLPGLFDSESDE